MPLQDGLYQIRWLPKGIKLPFLGGVYATGDIKHSPVRAEALGPEAGNQKVKHYTRNVLRVCSSLIPRF